MLYYLSIATYQNAKCKLMDSKQRMYLFSQSFHRTEAQAQLRCQGVGWTRISSEGSTKEESPSKITQVTGRIHFLALQDGGPHFLADCWLKATLSP